jgi:thiol:disulfide interchange protein
MARTDQRAIPIALFIIALVLVAARIAVPLMKRDAPRAGDAVQWLALDEGLRLASTSDKPVLLDFTADWCAPCHILDAQVFRNPDIARKINERFIAIRVTDRRREEGRNAPEVDELQQRYAVRGFPTVVFADRTGERARMEGFRGREEFERLMESVR